MKREAEMLTSDNQIKVLYQVCTVNMELLHSQSTIDCIFNLVWRKKFYFFDNQIFSADATRPKNIEKKNVFSPMKTWKKNTLKRSTLLKKFWVLPKTARSAQTVKNPHRYLFNVSILGTNLWTKWTYGWRWNLRDKR